MKNKLNLNLKTNSKTIVLAILMTTVILLAIPSMSITKAQTGSGVTGSGGMVTLPGWATSVPSGVTPNATVQTEAFMSVTPATLGVGQTILVNLWMEPPMQTNRFYSGYTVTITKPDGTTETIGPFNSYQGDATAYFDYAPSQVGNYTFQFSFPGNYFPAGYYYNGAVYPTLASIGNYVSGGFTGPVYIASSYYQPSQSPSVTISVQQNMIASWPPAQLPTDYWTFPIPIDYREWWIIGGQYPFDGQGGGPGWPANTNTFASNYKYTPYVHGPTTAHIVWLQQGGIVSIAGGQFGYRSIGSGETAYSGLPAIFFQGRAYQTVTIPTTVVINGSVVTEPASVWECYNVQTGQVYWQQTGITQPPTLVTQNIGAPSEPGAGQTGMGTGTWALLYVSASRMITYDPWNGAVEVNITLPFASATVYDDPNVLSVQNLAGGAHALVNWTLPIAAAMGGATNPITVNSNISWPFTSLGTCDYQSMVAVQTGTITPIGVGTAQGQLVMGVSLLTGQLLWNVTTNDIFFSTSTGVADHGMYAVRCLGGFWDCWNLANGNLAWQTAKVETPGGETYPWGDFGAYTIASYGGLLFDFSYAGIYAINWTNGQFAWHFVTPAVPFEVPWGSSMSLFSNAPQIANGVLYYANGEHSPTEPLARGWFLWGLNALTGQEIWNMTGGGQCGAISGGYMAFAGTDDGFLYIFGKGPSATTVSAPQTGVTANTPVVISGTVLDQSPGMISPNTAPLASKPVYKNDPAISNVACVSDDSMSTYMGYLYQQQPIDGLYHNVTVTGVPVSLYAIDSSGKSTLLATVTSDITGSYSYTWTPTTAGDYKINAVFAGTDAYGSSYAESHVTVANAQVSTPTPTAAPVQAATDYTMTIVTMGIAVIIAVVLVGAVLALVLRKRP